MDIIITHQNNEVWLPVPDYKGYYEVSNFGGVKSLNRTIMTVRGKVRLKGKIKSPKADPDGYPCISLCRDDISRKITVHRLVGLAFIPNPNKKQLSINHKDGNKLNNHVSNLEWATLEENTKHQWATGLANDSGCFKGILNFKIAEEIRTKRKEHKYTHQKLADMYGVSQSNITCILNNKTWKLKS